MNPRPRISVVIPTHNGAGTLAACLQSLQSSSYAPHEIIVVDDASSDHSAEIASRLHCRVVRMDRNVGAAQAKNCGAQAATGEILLFTDDDVIVSPGTLERVGQVLSAEDVTGVVGLLARGIPFRDFASNYKNLWMRYTYDRLPRRRVGVFYTSIAAIRRPAFLQIGGFDERYRGASIAEDTEFGQRAWSAGHLLVVDPDVEVTHCKAYTPGRVLATDYGRARALVLMRLRKWGQAFFTSVPLFYQLAVPVALAAVACLAAAVLLLNGIALATGVLLVLVFFALNASWLGYLARERGLRFACAAALFQPADTLVVGAGMAAAAVEFVCGVRY